MSNPRGVAANPTTGNVVVADLENSRLVEFTVWGEFVKAWGFGVLPGSPDTELQSCTAQTGCEKGVEGTEPGQLSGPAGVAIDSTGAVYVFDLFNNRVVKYDEEGNFLLMFGGEVNDTDNANVCTAADVTAGDECGAGVSGTAPGFFANGTVGNFIDVSSSDTIYVGDKDRIQEFNPDGTFKSQIPFNGAEAPPAGTSAWGLAMDPVSGDVYVSTNVAEGLYRVDPATGVFVKVQDVETVGSEDKTFPQVPAGLAVDSGGNLYVVDHRETFGFDGPFEVLKFSPTGECLICGAKFAQPDNVFARGKALLGLATSDACGIPGNNLYVTVSKGNPNIEERLAYLQSYGPAPQDVENCPPPEVAPEITDQYATDAGTEDAAVQARINPRFWKDTTYYVQYGPQECLDSGWTTGCSTVPAPPGDLLTDKVLSAPVPTDEILLEGLSPDTVYHYRFVAQSTGGGPVIGIDGTETEEGESSSFRTFPLSLAPKACPDNQPFRTGLSAFLPDCRAYEMVSPVDKKGGDILSQKSIRSYPTELSVSALDGEEVTFSSETAFANSVSAPYTNQYLAKRDPSAGWQTEAISPPREKLFRPAGTAQLYELDNQYKLFSPELDAAWLMQEADPPLDECGVEGFINWYKRDNATGSYEAITTKAPPVGKDPLSYFSEVQGASIDSEGRTHTIYRANDKLPLDSGPAAANITGYQLYEHISDPGGGCGETRLVSVLPAGTASTTESSAGTAAAGTSGASWIEARENLVHNAVSTDGSRVYWTAAGEGSGVLYVRVNGTQTIKVSTGSSARFWHAAADGSVAYYTEGETLRRFAFPGPSSTVVATQVIGLVGASEDASRVYFVSKADLGGDAVAGQPNLYLNEGATTTYIGTLTTSDVTGARLTPVTALPIARRASLSEDGRFLAFTSTASLTGNDNIDANSGLPDSEAYYFEADSGELRCVSCNFTGARPSGREFGLLTVPQGYAAGIPPWKNQFHAPRVISGDGSVVYFESLERLVPRDQNGNQDVYQWRRADSEAECQAAGAELYNPVAGGCISLISSGTGGDASFVDATPDGSDVFFKTPTSLLPQDPGRVDLYDARVGGGFPQPITPVCEANPEAPQCIKQPDPVPPVTPPNSKDGSGQFDPAKCKPLQKQAKRLAAKARKLRAKAAKAQGPKAKALRKQAKRATKKANAKSAQAQACYTGARGR